MSLQLLPVQLQIPSSQLLSCDLCAKKECAIIKQCTTRKVVWSRRPLALVYSGLVHPLLRLARSPSEGPAAPAEAAAIWEFAPEDISGYQRIAKDT